jgi:hypothetical protein
LYLCRDKILINKLKTMSVEKKEVVAQEFGYIGDETISIPVKEYFKLKEMVDECLVENTVHHFPEKYMYVDVVTGVKVEKLTPKNKSTSKKIVNVEATMSATPTVSRTPKGMAFLEMKLFMNQLHLNHIESGVAKHIPTLQAQEKEMQDRMSRAEVLQDDEVNTEMTDQISVVEVED